MSEAFEKLEQFDPAGTTTREEYRRTRNGGEPAGLIQDHVPNYGDPRGRSMTKPRWRNPDKRMARAVELRAQGWSLRRIGTELAVSAGTIRNDLARWEGQQTSCPVIPMRDRCAIAPVQLRTDCTSAIAQEAKEEGA